MTILELIRKLYRDTHVEVKYGSKGETLDFWSMNYFCEILDSQKNKIIENTEVLSFDFEDGKLIIYVACFQGV